MSTHVQNAKTDTFYSANRSDLMFISLDWSRPKDIRTPLSTASIEAYFRENQSGYVNAEFKSFNLNSPDFDVRDVRKSIEACPPKFLALGAYIWNEKYLPGIVKWVKTHYPETIIILGGPQVTYGNHHLVREYPGADYLVRGEGERPFTELVNALSLGVTPNTDLLNRYAIYTPKLLKQGKCDRIFTTELDRFPSPYLSNILPVNQNQAFVRWETVRRCPYQCSFCQFRVEGHHKVSEINLDRLFQELTHFKEKEVREINVLDPIFNLKPKHYLEICKKIEALEMQSRFYFQCRLELLCKPHGAEFLKFCQGHDVWLEFGVQTFREVESNAIQRGNHYPKINEAIERLHRFNVPFDLHLIFGLPYQSFKDFRWSYEQARAARPRGLYLFPLNVLKGTNLYQKRKEWQYEFDPMNNNVFLKSKWMEKHEVEHLKKIAEDINRCSKSTRENETLIQLPNL